MRHEWTDGGLDYVVDLTPGGVMEVVPDGVLHREIIRLAEDASLLAEILETLGRFVGETGENEGAMDVLRRIVTDRQRLSEENAKHALAEVQKGAMKTFTSTLTEAATEFVRMKTTGTAFEASLKAEEKAEAERLDRDLVAEEIAALKATLAEVQQAERWLAGAKWDARLSLLAAEFRDRASLLRGTTTWEQAYRQAAIDLEEVIEQMAKESPEPAKEAPKAEIIEPMEALKASLAVAPKRKE